MVMVVMLAHVLITGVSQSKAGGALRVNQTRRDVE